MVSVYVAYHCGYARKLQALRPAGLTEHVEHCDEFYFYYYYY